MSPVIRVSKNAMGRFINLIKKSETSEILMRVLKCNNIQLRITSMAVLPINNASCANRIK